MFINPVMNGMAMKKIMIVPCELKILVEMLGRQVAAVVQRHRLLGAHQ